MQAGLDIGNTRSKLGLYFEDGTIQVKQIERTHDAIHAAIRQYEVDSLIVSSVSGDMVDDVQLMKSLNTFLFLTHHTPLPIQLQYDTPETLGRDRIALAVGAWSHNERRPNPWLIVDAGTCITLDILDENGSFLGGSISPGIAMRMKAMNTFTANLPLVSLENLDTQIGKSTKEALILGAAQGAVLEIEGFFGLMKQRFSGLNLMLTGGDAAYISDSISSKIFLQPNLLHEGLREILRYNAN